jgi:putative hydrolase of the HAD superfamily
MTYAVLFDLDETLLDRTSSLRAFLTDQHRRYGNALGDVLLEDWQTKFLELDARGHVHKSIVYPMILSTFGGEAALADELLDDYRSRCCEYALPFEGMTETLCALRSRGVALGLITNGETIFQSRHVAALGLRELVDVVLISEAEGLRKPDPALFLRGVARLGVVPSRSLFVGDNPSADILGAHAVGMKTAWFHCGQSWPEQLPRNPGASIERLCEVLGLVPSDPGRA